MAKDVYVMIVRGMDDPDKPVSEVWGSLPMKRKDETGDFVADGKMYEIKTEKQLLEFINSQDSDEADWALLKFTKSGVRLVDSGSGYYRNTFAEG